MTKTAPTTITLIGDPLRKEAAAGGTIKPGHLVELDSSGDFIVQATLGKDCQRTFALENDLIGDGVTDAYLITEQVQAGAFKRGEVVHAKLAAAAAAIVIGDQLEAAADGTLKIFAAGTAIPTALEAVDNSGGGSEVFIKAEVL